MNNCSVCDKKAASYKCPTCRSPYCSVLCCKEHKTLCHKTVEVSNILADDDVMMKVATKTNVEAKTKLDLEARTFPALLENKALKTLLADSRLQTTLQQVRKN